MVQQATAQVIGPLFESRFLPCSFGYRPGRGARQAVWWVREAIRQGDRWAAEFDIVGFFDNLRHPRLLREVSKVVDDPEVVGLVRRWLVAGVLTDGGLVPRGTGTPQGGVISPLLANIYLHRLDVEVRAAGYRLIRYADDFVILADRRWKAEAADRLVRRILADIGLAVAEDKSGIVRTRDGFDFLGFTVHGRFLDPDPGHWPASRTRFETNPAQANRSPSMDDRTAEPPPSWVGPLFALGDVVRLFVDLDKWIRMRLRSAARRRFKSKGGIDHHRWPNRLFDELGLVRLEHLARQARVSPA